MAKKKFDPVKDQRDVFLYHVLLSIAKNSESSFRFADTVAHTQEMKERIQDVQKALGSLLTCLGEF